MAISIETKNNYAQINVEGEMTIFVAQEIKDALKETLQKAREIEFDLSQVTEIDSAGLQIMIMAKRQSLARGTELRFTGHSAPVQEVLDLTNLGSFFGDPVVIQA